MKYGAKPTSNLMTKTRKKSSTKSMKKQSKMEMVAQVKSEERPNKHHSYLKIVKDEKTGIDQVSGTDSRNIFYCGTFDEDLISSTLDQIIAIYSKGKNLSKIGIRQVNASLASILEIDPQDSTELMLASQMITVHNLSMEMSRRAMLSEQTFEGVNQNVNRAVKLMRTYTAQVEALTKYCNKGSDGRKQVNNPAYQGG